MFAALASLRRRRRAAIVVLAALLLTIMMGFMAMAIDLGYIVLVRTELQSAADSAALAAAGSMSQSENDIIASAQRYASLNLAANRPVTLSDGDVEFGTWDASALTFTPTGSVGNAVRTTVRFDSQTANRGLFFARIFGKEHFALEASAVAMGNPRDIAFVVDLSGSMNNDTEPCWATYEITQDLQPQGFPDVGSGMMQKVYDEFSFGAFPGSLEWIGSPLVTANSSAYANLTKNAGPLTGASIPAQYRISSGDSESTRKTKAYRFLIDGQLAALMPAAMPHPNSATNFNYWSKYLDYVIERKNVSGRGYLPPNQDSFRLTGGGNPDNSAFPDATSAERDSYLNRVGYRTYAQFMMDCGRNVRPDDVNYVPLSVNSPYCPYHSESTAGGTFQFPPSEEPMNSVRRSVIAGIEEVRRMNATIPDENQRDWVSIITFDTVNGTRVRQPLTGDYAVAMQACATMQATGDDALSTATETGLIAARQHICRPEDGGQGRRNTHKVIVLLTDGMPNLKSSSNGTVDGFINSNPSSDFCGDRNLDAALMQAMSMQGERWNVYAVGVGLGTDYDFMDRLARTGGTANGSGASPRTSGNPLGYESEVSAIFRKIITNPKIRLVQ